MDGRVTRGRRLSIHSAVTLLFLLTSSGSFSADSFGQKADRPGGAELVYADSLNTWFEDDFTHGIPTPDGRLLASRGLRIRRALLLVEGSELAVDSLAAGYGLDELYGVRPFGGRRMAFAGKLDQETGWFLEAGDSLLFTGIGLRTSADWSADASKVVLYEPGSDSLRIRENGKEMDVFIGQAAAPPIWGPRGEHVYALVWADTGSGTLLQVDASRATTSVIRKNLYIPIYTISIAISPDGREILLALADSSFSSAESRHDPDGDRDLDIYAIDISSTELRLVAGNPGDEFAPIVVGADLYWTRNAYEDDVVVVPAGGGGARTLVENAVLPTWSPDGRHLSVTRGLGGANGPLSSDAAYVEIDDAGQVLGSLVPIVTGWHEDFSPRWSPDGSWIAYHSHRSTAPVHYYDGEGTTDDIFLRRANEPESSERRLTDFGWEVGMPDWSPDGRFIVFDSWERGGAPGISKLWIVEIDPKSGDLLGIQGIPLPDGVDSGFMPAWAPERDEIAMEARIKGARRQLLVTNRDGSRARKLIEYTSTTYGGVDWSRDGKDLVYSGLADGRMQIFQVSLDGGTPRRLTNDSANLLHPEISPDGRFIAATRLVRVKEVWRMSPP